MPKVSLHTDQRGSLLVEAMLAGAVFGLLVMALVGVLSYATLSARIGGNRARAAFLAEEGLEATRNLRDASYSNLTNGTFGLATTGNQWSLSGASDVTDIFTRAVTIADSTTNVKQVTSTVTWQQNPQRTGSVSAITYLTNWLIAKSGVGNWALPLLTTTQDISGTEDAIKIQIAGNFAYVLRASTTADFLVFNITNPALPVLVGSMNLSGTPNNLVVSGNYAYVTSDTDAQEVQIVNIATPTAPALAASVNLTGTTNATGIALAGGLLYVGRLNSTTNELNIVNVATPTAPVILGSIGLLGNVTEIAVSGNYAYVATTDDTMELQVVNISVSLLPVFAGSLNLAGAEDALTIALTGTTAAIGEVGGGLSIINIANPLVPAQLGSVSLGGDVNDIVFGNAGKYIFAATSNAAAEFRVIDITTPASPNLLGQVDAAGDMEGVAYDPATDRAYGVSAANAAEFVVYRPS